MSNYADHYWLVGERPGEVYASERQSFVSDTDPEYLARKDDPVSPPSHVETEDELIEVLKRFGIPPYHQVSTFTPVTRLAEADLLAVAEAALLQDPVQHWRFSQATYVDAYHFEVIGLLTAIGADVEAMLAPEEE